MSHYGTLSTLQQMINIFPSKQSLKNDTKLLELKKSLLSPREYSWSLVAFVGVRERSQRNLDIYLAFAWQNRVHKNIDWLMSCEHVSCYNASLLWAMSSVTNFDFVKYCSDHWAYIILCRTICTNCTHIKTRIHNISRKTLPFLTILRPKWKWLKKCVMSCEF